MASDRDAPALWILAGLLAVCALYITDAEAPLFSALSGIDRIDAALDRERAIKLNPDVVFVRIYVTARDLLGPIAVALGVDALLRTRGRTTLPALAGIVLALYIGLWSAQKATVVNYLVAVVIFLARGPGHLYLLAARAAPFVALIAFALFVVTYAGVQEYGFEVASNVFEGLLYRIFVGPFEVSMAYFDSIDRPSPIERTDVIPVLGALLNPQKQSIENTIGLSYFFSGIDSISANALAFGYTYVAGGFLMCAVAGFAVPLVLFASVWFVRLGGNGFVTRAYAAYLCYLSLDLLGGNPFNYSTQAIQFALLAWLVARISAGTPLLASLPRRLGSSSGP